MCIVIDPYLQRYLHGYQTNLKGIYLMMKSVFLWTKHHPRYKFTDYYKSNIFATPFLTSPVTNEAVTVSKKFKDFLCL